MSPGAVGGRPSPLCATAASARAERPPTSHPMAAAAAAASGGATAAAGGHAAATAGAPAAPPAAAAAHTVTLSTGSRMPQLGFGTWQVTGAECKPAVAAALAAGYRHIDTAAVYRNEKEVSARGHRARAQKQHEAAPTMSATCEKAALPVECKAAEALAARGDDLRGGRDGGGRWRACRRHGPNGPWGSAPHHHVIARTARWRAQHLWRRPTPSVSPCCTSISHRIGRMMWMCG